MRLTLSSKAHLAFASLVIFALCLIALPSTAEATGTGKTHTAHSIPTTQQDWNMFSFNHSRYDPYEHILNPKNVSQLVPDWSIGPAGDLECSSVVVENGIGYIVVFGGYNGIVYAFNVETGAKLWSASRSDLAIQCVSAAVVNGVLYVTDGAAYAFNAATGQILWENNKVGAFTSPVVANGLVYFGAAGENIDALDAKTGDLRWTESVNSYYNSYSPTVANGILYIGGYDNKLYAFDALTGKKLWAVPTGGFVYSTPAVDAGNVYIYSAQRVLEAFNATTGARLWIFRFNAEDLSASPAAANGVVYAPGNGKLYAFDGATGHVLWKASPGGSYAPAVANGVVYMSIGVVGLEAFDAKTGKLLWSYISSGNGDQDVCSPTVDNGMLYVGTAYGYLDGFDLPGQTS